MKPVVTRSTFALPYASRSHNATTPAIAVPVQSPTRTPPRVSVTCGLGWSGRDEGVRFGHHRRLQVEAFVLVVDATVVDLDRYRAHSARCLVSEPQDLGRLAG